MPDTVRAVRACSRARYSRRRGPTSINPAVSKLAHSRLQAATHSVGVTAEIESPRAAKPYRGSAPPDPIELKCRWVVRAAVARPSCDKPRRPRQSFSSRPNALPFDLGSWRPRASGGFMAREDTCAPFWLQFSAKELSRTLLAFSITVGPPKGDQRCSTSRSSGRLPPALKTRYAEI